MNMQAIETEYKGYKFRSRLEARWAVALSKSNVAWEYEPEGFVASGMRVLPDFYLPRYNTYIEVKPMSAYQQFMQVPQLYFAGKMGEPISNKIPGTCWRQFYEGRHNVEVFEDDVKRIAMQYKGKQFFYTGPFKGVGDYHGYYHGITTCGGVDERDILAKALRGIDSCTTMLVYIEDETAYGTIAEIGYAHAKAKRIVVAVNKALCTSEYGGVDEVRPSTYWGSDVWFACTMADKVFWVDDAQDALTKLFAEVRFSVPDKDFSALASMENYGIVFGDPMEHILVTPKSLRVSEGTPRLAIITHEAAQIARQARFEYGQTPA